MVYFSKRNDLITRAKACIVEALAALDENERAIHFGSNWLDVTPAKPYMNFRIRVGSYDQLSDDIYTPNAALDAMLVIAHEQESAISAVDAALYKKIDAIEEYFLQQDNRFFTSAAHPDEPTYLAVLGVTPPINVGWNAYKNIGLSNPVGQIGTQFTWNFQWLEAED